MQPQFVSYPKQPAMQTSDFELALHALRERQTEIMQAIGKREVEITPGLIDELAGLEMILGVYPLEEVFHD